jgi:hypothetical protein
VQLIEEEKSPLVWVGRLWNAILAVITFGWFVLLAYISIRLVAQGAWGMAAVAAILTLLLFLATIGRLIAVGKGETHGAGLDAFVIFLSFLGIDAKK